MTRLFLRHIHQAHALCLACRNVATRGFFRDMHQLDPASMQWEGELAVFGDQPPARSGGARDSSDTGRELVP
jgi:hypothetical protein